MNELDRSLINELNDREWWSQRHYKAICGTKLFRDSYLFSTLEDAADHARVLLQHMIQRELERKQHGIRGSQNDPEYPLKEAQELVLFALKMCDAPEEIWRLAAHLLFRPKPVQLLGAPEEWTKPESWQWTGEPDYPFYFLKGMREYRFYLAAQHLSALPQTSGSKLAKKLGVDQKTIAKWKTEEHFIDYMQCFIRAVRGYYDAAHYLAKNPIATNREVAEKLDRVAKKCGADHEWVAEWKTEEHFIDYQKNICTGPLDWE